MKERMYFRAVQCWVHVKRVQNTNHNRRDFGPDSRRGEEGTYPTAFTLEETIFSILLTPDLCLKGRGENREGKRSMKRKVNFTSQLQLHATVTAGLILSPSVKVLGTAELQCKEN